MKITPELIRKYHAGGCNAEEAEAIKEWLDSSELEVDNFPANQNGDYVVREEMWENLAGRVTADLKNSEVNWSFRRTIQPLWPYLSAACLLLLLGYAYTHQQKSRVQVAATIIPQPVKYHLYKTVNGQKTTFTIEDGTEIVLNAGSELRVQEPFDDTSRKVLLRGEAFFKVAKDANRPFCITSDKSTTTVLGTMFNLSAYLGEPEILTVKEGRVQFSEKKSIKNSVILTQGQQGICLADLVTKKSVDVESSFAWTTDQLVFEDETLAQIVLRLERWYGVEILVKKKELESVFYKGKFRNPALPLLLEDLSYVMNFRFYIKNKTVTIY